MRKFITLLAASALSIGVAQAKPLDYKVIPTSPVSMVANVTLITGEKDAVLVDVPFARSDAMRVAAEVLDSGKTLKAIIITHDHPDHFFGLDVLQDAFPEAKIIANPVAAKDMARSIPIKFKRWSGQLGTNAPRRPVQPVAMTGDSFDLEGHKLQVMGPMQGDHVHSTVVWDEETRTLIAGDILYNGVYVWLGEHGPAQYDAWLKVLDQLVAQGAGSTGSAEPGAGRRRPHQARPARRQHEHRLDPCLHQGLRRGAQPVEDLEGTRRDHGREVSQCHRSLWRLPAGHFQPGRCRRNSAVG